MKTTFFSSACNGAAYFCRDMQSGARSYKQERRQAHQHKTSKHLNNPLLAALSSTTTHSHPACHLSHEECVALLAGPVMLLLLVHTLREVDNMYKDKNMLVSCGLLGWLSMQRAELRVSGQQQQRDRQDSRLAAIHPSLLCSMYTQCFAVCV
jgi:hypothetical protein